MEAIGYLQTALRFGPVRVSVLRNEAEHREPPINSRALYDAKKYLQIEEYEEVSTVGGRTYKYWKMEIADTGDDDDGPAF